MGWSTLSSIPRGRTTASLGRLGAVGLITIHLLALAVMMWSEVGLLRKAAFLLTWGIFNFFWLALLRRPLVSAALSFSMLAVLVIVGRYKFGILWMPVN